MITHRRFVTVATLLLLSSVAVLARADEPKVVWKQTGTLSAPETHQAAAAVMLLVNGALQKAGLSFENAASLLSLLFLVGIVLLVWAPEIKGTELPE